MHLTQKKVYWGFCNFYVHQGYLWFNCYGGSLLKVRHHLKSGQTSIFQTQKDDIFFAGNKQNGVTRTEISEILTHIAFYAGWPNAWGAFRLAKDVWADDSTADNGMAAFQREMIFPIGQPNTAYAKYFIGNSYLAPISSEQIPFNNVTFEPRCRNNWHIHHATRGGGQMLVCVAGRGWYQEEGKPAVQMLPGDVIHIPANVKHWHGAAADSWFAHLAFEIPGENASNEWLEPVTDEEYNQLGK